MSIVKQALAAMGQTTSQPSQPSQELPISDRQNTPVNVGLSDGELEDASLSTLLLERDRILDINPHPNDIGAQLARQEAIDNVNAVIDGRNLEEVLDLRNDLIDNLYQFSPNDPRRAVIQDKINGINGLLPYGSIQQLSSHNSFDTDDHNLSITDQFNQEGIHSFELDIHHGDPDKFFEVGDDETLDGDYPVYHASWDTGTRIDSLTVGLQEVGGLNNHEPITLFIDLKNDPLLQSEELSRDIFDDVLREELGPKLYTPQDWIDSVPGASTLEEAFEIGGWPTLEDLDGRVMVVVTGGDMDGQLGEYVSNGAGNQAAFIAPKPDTGVSPDAVFYNTSDLDAAIEMNENGYATRLYHVDNPEDFQAAQDAGINHIAVNEGDSSDNMDYADDSDNDSDLTFTPLAD